MTTPEYLQALRELGLKPHAMATAKLIGKEIRQCQNYAMGASPIDPTVALLLQMYLRHGLPSETITPEA